MRALPHVGLPISENQEDAQPPTMDPGPLSHTARHAHDACPLKMYYCEKYSEILLCASQKSKIKNRWFFREFKGFFSKNLVRF